MVNYLAAYLSTPFIQREIRFEQNGASREGLTLSSIRDLKVLVPSINEQEEILIFISNQCRKIILISQKARREISLLNEYRTRLITDVVTGKLDVRQAAVKLPDIGEEPALMEETDIGEETDTIEELESEE